jgi:hypothetical protein
MTRPCAVLNCDRVSPRRRKEAAVATTNLERLHEAGLIRTNEPLPPEYQAVVEGLTEDEADVIVAVKRRLDEADRSREAYPPDPDELPAFTGFMTF